MMFKGYLVLNTQHQFWEGKNRIFFIFNIELIISWIIKSTLKMFEIKVNYSLENYLKALIL